MSDTLTVNPKIAGAESSDDEVRTDPNFQSWTLVPKRRPRRVPLFMPRGQAYYWSHEWQEGEAEADVEIGRGEARTFNDPGAAMRWLDDPED